MTHAIRLLARNLTHKLISTPSCLLGVVLSTPGVYYSLIKRLSRSIMVQIRSLEIAEVTKSNGEHITVRSESALDRVKLTTFPLRLQPRNWYPIGR